MSDYHCTQRGHVWIEADGTPYVRHRGRTPGDVDVACRYCDATASLPANARSTAPPQSMPPALDGEALAAVQSRLASVSAARANIGSVPKVE